MASREQIFQPDDPEQLTTSEAARLMWHALELAGRAAGYVAPNPVVGAVLVHCGRIIGQGYHRKYGGDHAEVDCLDAVKPEDRHLIPESDLLVTLEPCAHFGKTPPCADRIIREGIRRVWIGCRDPFPLVDGKGIEKLEEAGVQVYSGILEKECREINRRFFCFHTRQRPYVILKWAETADGFMANEQHALPAEKAERLLISNEWSNRIVHRWRSEEAAILVGWRTALMDNPQLTNRYWQGPQPLRVLIDPELRVPSSHHLFHTCPTRLYNYQKSGVEGTTTYIQLSKAADLLPQLLQDLHAQDIQSVLVEGGAATLSAFLKAGLWDEARVIRNERLFIAKGLVAPMLPGTTIFSETQWGNDRHLIYLNPALIKAV